MEESIEHITRNYRNKINVITGRPARSAATPVGLLFLLNGPKMGFRPAGATGCPDKRKNWHGERTARGSGPQAQVRSLVPNFTFIGAKCRNTAPKTVKISNFGQKFVPQGRLVCSMFTKFSAFVHVYR